MEQWEVVAVDKDATMRIREENKQYKGVRWLLKALEWDERQFLGYAWRDQFVSNERLEKLKVKPMPGDIITLYFDRSGAIAQVVIN